MIYPIGGNLAEPRRCERSIPDAVSWFDFKGLLLRHIIYIDT